MSMYRVLAKRARQRAADARADAESAKSSGDYSDAFVQGLLNSAAYDDAKAAELETKANNEDADV